MICNKCNCEIKDILDVNSCWCNVIIKSKKENLKTFNESLKDAKVGDDIIIHAENGSIEYILELKAKESRFKD